jgi:hypothetical protein
MHAVNEGKRGSVRRLEQVWELRPTVVRLQRNACTELSGRHLQMRAERRKDADYAGHRGEDADQLSLAVPLESPGCGEANGRDTGHDTEPLCHGTEARRQVNECRFVHGLLQIKGEHGHPDEPDNVIVSWWKRERAQHAPGLCREVGELAAQGRSLGLRAAEVLSDAGDGRFDGPRFDVATQPCEVGLGERDGRRHDWRNG